MDEQFVIRDNHGNIFNKMDSFVNPTKCSRDDVVIEDFNTVSKLAKMLIKEGKCAIIETIEWAEKFYGKIWGVNV